MKYKRLIISVGVLIFGILASFIFHLIEVKTTSFNPDMVTKYFDSYEKYDNKAYLDESDCAEKDIVVFKMEIKNASVFSLNDINVIINESKLEAQNIFLIDSLNGDLCTSLILPKGEMEMKMFFLVSKNEEIKKIKSALENNIIIKYKVNDVNYECK